VSRLLDRGDRPSLVPILRRRDGNVPPVATRAGFATAVAEDQVLFRFPDPSHALVEVRVWLNLGSKSTSMPMNPVNGGWELAVVRPPVWRLEYLFEQRAADGSQGRICDPSIMCRVRTVFGEHSVIEFAAYRRPRWLTAPTVRGTTRALTVADGHCKSVAVTVWAPAATSDDEPLPMLLVHDGPEFDALAAISGFSAAMIAAGRLPSHRLALLAPGDRNRWYAASADYADALTRAVVPALSEAVAVRGRPVLTGASLGALAALHAASRTPGTFGGLFLQSGSFFRIESDDHERSFPSFGAITAFVSGVPRQPWTEILTIGMTCGLAEENLSNNRQMATALARCGHRVRLAELPDAHTFTAWRDALDPHLLDLLVEVWS
jgi:enterochelin esterase-like enzyme